MFSLGNGGSIIGGGEDPTPIEDSLAAPAQRQRAYLKLTEVQIKTIEAWSKGTKLLDSGRLDIAERAKVSTDTRNLLANIEAMTQGRNTLAELAQAEGDDWVNESPAEEARKRLKRLASTIVTAGVITDPDKLPGVGNLYNVAPVSSLYNVAPVGALPVWVIVTLFIAGGAVIITSIYMLTDQANEAKRYAEITENAFDAFNSCLEEAGDKPEQRAQCSRVLDLAAQTVPELTKAVKARASARLWFTALIGLGVVGGVVYYAKNKGKKK